MNSWIPADFNLYKNYSIAWLQVQGQLMIVYDYKQLSTRHLTQ